MEKSFDFGAILKRNEKKHKSKPTQFVSVSGGVQKRRETNIKNRKSYRLTVFDSIRNLPRCESPPPISEAQLKMDHRRQQLEKWKIEKEQKKKEQAAQKKKPFVTGVARVPLNFVLPPPLKPSTSGRVTRSQTRSAIRPPLKTKRSPPKPTPRGHAIQSFAPKNASFKPPEIKNLAKLPKLAPPSMSKNPKTSMITFEPVLPDKLNTVKQLRSRPVLTRQNAVKTEPLPLTASYKSRIKQQADTKCTKMTKKTSPKKQMQSSSSSSDIEPAKLKAKTPRKSWKEPKQITPKVLAMESTSEENSSGSSQDKPKRKSLRSTHTSLEEESNDSSKDKSKKTLSRSSHTSSEEKSSGFSEDKPKRKSLRSTHMSSKEKSNGSSNDKSKRILTKSSHTSSEERSSGSTEVKSNRKSLGSKHVSSEEKSSDSSCEKTMRKSLKSTHAVKGSESSSDKLSTDYDDLSSYGRPSGKSFSKNFSPQRPISISSDRMSSDVEFIGENTPLKVPRSESNSEQKFRSPKSPIEVPLTPEQMESAKISPCVTMSRGKDNARKEMKWKIAEGLLDSDVSDIDSVDYFRKQLSSEIKRMTDMCNTWDKISEQVALPEFVQEAVLAAVGQARLLMSKKLQQFSSLLDSHDRPEPNSTLITPADLRGFWDMVFLQVENVDLRFKKLEELRQRNWVEETPRPEHKQTHRQASKARPGNKKTTKAAGGASRIREMIAAARLAKKQQEPSQPGDGTLPAAGEKTFEGGFFSVRSPVRSPRPAHPATPAGPTLLKAVLSSEANKASRNSTPFAMLRASIMAKNAECEGVAPLPQTPEMDPVNILATPGRSILKSTNNDTNKSGKKSIKVVLFHPTENEETSPSLLDKKKHRETFYSALDVDFTQPKDDLDIQNKENSLSPEVTSKQRKSVSNDENKEVKTPRRSSRIKRDTYVVQTEEGTEKTPRRSSGRQKVKEVTGDDEPKSTKRSTRKQALQVVEANVLEDTVPTSIRSTRRNKYVPGL